MKPGKKHTKRQHSKKSGGPPRHVKKRGQGTRGLTDVMALVITEITEDGELLAAPDEWTSRKQPPIIFISDSRQGPAASVGDRVLASLRRISAHEYKAHVIRILPAAAAKTVVGIFIPLAGGNGVIEPVSRRSKESYSVAKADVNGALGGELVKGATLPNAPSRGLPQARVEERLGDARAPRAASLIAAHLHNLPSVFSAAALAEAEAAAQPVLTSGREDIRSLPLVTIDGEDARDFDDAVFAEPDTDPKNPGGFHLVVAIADVAYYVTEHSALDLDAYTRGNSAYFPDRVIPMLPERLSNGLCSLKPQEDRYCIAVHLWIDAQGNTRRYRFIRALMCSRARLTYTEVEHAGRLQDEKLKSWIANLFDAYRALKRERDRRGTLEINLPEYKVHFDAAGHVDEIMPREHLESHRLIEAFMVTANVAAADFLLKQRAPGIYRVHEAPSEDKLEELRKFLGASGYSLPKGAIAPAHLNRVLHKASQASNAAMIHTAVLRSQMQAYYDAKNLGHFGLGLKQYCHFTSPIRRYADLIVHRSLAALLNNDKNYRPAQNLKEIASHISETERTAMMAERDAMDRYKIAYLARQTEKVFSGTITGLNEYGLFVSLKGNGITGFVPVHQLGDDFFLYQPRTMSFTGRHSKQTYMQGDTLSVRVIEADTLKGSLIFRPQTTKKSR